jgi:hypothetical protein
MLPAIPEDENRPDLDAGLRATQATVPIKAAPKSRPPTLVPATAPETTLLFDECLVRASQASGSAHLATVEAPQPAPVPLPLEDEDTEEQRNDRLVDLAREWIDELHENDQNYHQGIAIESIDRTLKLLLIRTHPDHNIRDETHISVYNVVTNYIIKLRKHYLNKTMPPALKITRLSKPPFNAPINNLIFRPQEQAPPPSQEAIPQPSTTTCSTWSQSRYTTQEPEREPADPEEDAWATYSRTRAQDLNL